MQEKQEILVWTLVRKIPWRRKWQPTPVFLPGKFHGQRRLALQSIGLQRVRHDSAIEHTWDNWSSDGCGRADDHEYYSNDLLVNYYNSTKWILLLLPFYRQENWDKKLNTLLWVTQIEMREKIIPGPTLYS